MWAASALATSLLLLAQAQDAHAFFRMPCKQPVVVERADPIVNPGAVSGHLHTIMGGVSKVFDFNMTYDTARASDCSTCMARADLSNYWTPSLFYRGQNGSFHRVKQVGGMTVYYLQRPGFDGEQLKAFPPGFRMLAGNPALRSYDPNSVEQNAVTHVCLYDGGETPGFQPKNCPAGLRTQVFFPSCWDGKNLDSADHKSHVSYPIEHFNGGKCPDTHPVHLVSIFYEILWDINEWADMWWDGNGVGHPFTLSMGDPTGYHGDFLNGWDTDVLQSAIDQCTNNSGVIEDCKLLDLRTDDEMGDCALPARVPDKLNGWIDRLPGCNDVYPGPDNAKMQPPSACGAPVTMLPKDTSIITAVAGWTTRGCGVDKGERILSKQYKNGAMTPQVCTAYCAENGYKFAGLEYSSECYCGNDLDATRLSAPDAACDSPCEGDPNSTC
ncbi:WSC-domain-containing protein, partial [Exidia glandulosa HHB12029]